MHISGTKERHAEGNRLRHSACVLLALAAALAVLLVGNVDVGQAQTAASLIEVQGGGTQIGFEGERALGIVTGASAGTGFDGWAVARSGRTRFQQQFAGSSNETSKAGASSTTVSVALQVKTVPSLILRVPPHSVRASKAPSFHAAASRSRGTS